MYVYMYAYTPTNFAGYLPAVRVVHTPSLLLEFYVGHQISKDKLESHLPNHECTMSCLHQSNVFLNYYPSFMQSSGDFWLGLTFAFRIAYLLVGLIS